MAKVTVKYEKPRTSGNREGWAKTVESISDSERGAKAFGGEYLVEGQQEFEEGTIILQVWHTGSVKNGGQDADLWRVKAGAPDGMEDASEGACWDWRREFVDLRKAAEALLEQAAEPTPEPEAAPGSVDGDLSGDYLSRMARAASRQEAAEIIRAHATQYLGGVGGMTMTPERRISLLEAAERCAEQLLRDYSHDADGEPIQEAHHPWREWLADWGWLPDRATEASLPNN